MSRHIGKALVVAPPDTTYVAKARQALWRCGISFGDSLDNCDVVVVLGDYQRCEHCHALLKAAEELSISVFAMPTAEVRGLIVQYLKAFNGSGGA